MSTRDVTIALVFALVTAVTGCADREHAAKPWDGTVFDGTYSSTMTVEEEDGDGPHTVVLVETTIEQIGPAITFFGVVALAEGNQYAFGSNSDISWWGNLSAPWLRIYWEGEGTTEKVDVRRTIEYYDTDNQLVKTRKTWWEFTNFVAWDPTKLGAGAEALVQVRELPCTWSIECVPGPSTP